MLSALAVVFALTASNLASECNCKVADDESGVLERRASEQGSGSDSTEASHGSHSGISSEASSGGHSTEASSGGHSSEASSGSHSAEASHGTCGHGSGDHHQWWEKDYEYSHFEGMVIIALVLATLLFDEIHHRTEELAEEAGHSTLLQHFVHHDAKKMHTKNLWVQLHQRCSGELSVLGFLAMLVWCSNQGGLFEKLAEAEHLGGITLPCTASDYLHTVENVHMHLFIAMCFYFCFLSILVAVASKLIAECVEGNKAIKKAYIDGVIKNGDELQFVSGKSSFVRYFVHLRKYYFICLEKWRGSWEFFDEHLKDFEDELLHNAQQVDKSLDASGAHLSMPVLMQKWFPFDLYAVVNYRHAMDDMIQVKGSTWLVICGLLLVQTNAQRVAKQELEMNTIWLVLGQCILGIIIFVTYYLFPRDNTEARGRRLSSMGWVHRIHPVTKLARVVQVCLFFTMFEFASTIASKSEWQKHPGRPGFFCFLLVIGGLFEGLLLGILLPLYSVLISTGPYMQERHIVRLQLIIKAYSGNSKSKLRELAENTEAFDELAKEEAEKTEMPTSHAPKRNCCCLPKMSHGRSRKVVDAPAFSSIGP